MHRLTAEIMCACAGTDTEPRARWTAAHLAQLACSPAHTIPPIAPDLPRPLFPGLDLWDMWPLQTPDGHVAAVAGSAWWFILSAPQLADPDARHAVARIRLVERRDDRWIDHGPAFPDDFTPGSREWAGSAVLEDAAGALTLYFTAAGTAGDRRDNWQQRLFAAHGALSVTADGARISWQAPEEILVADGKLYQEVTAEVGRAGFIKGFRDPAYFADPADGREYLLFTASCPASRSEYDGAVGLARKGADQRWHLCAPLLAMDGINNEPERPHIVAHAGRYYLFFSTQRRMFAPGVAAGPNGLYGMDAETMAGPWTPLNRSGLVAANPDTAPQQAYSWWVTADGAVFGFADMVGLVGQDPPDTAAARRRHFAGVPAPVFRLQLTEAETRLLPSD